MWEFESAGDSNKSAMQEEDIEEDEEAMRLDLQRAEVRKLGPIRNYGVEGRPKVLMLLLLSLMFLTQFGGGVLASPDRNVDGEGPQLGGCLLENATTGMRSMGFHPRPVGRVLGCGSGTRILGARL